MKIPVDTRKLFHGAYGVEPDDGSTALPKPDASEVAKARIGEQVDMVRRLAARIAAEMPGGTVASYMPLARAILHELREPTGNMLRQAFPDMTDCAGIVRDWQALIDAALACDESLAGTA